MTTSIMLQNVIIIYPKLFTPEPYKEKGMPKGDPKFQARFLLPADFDWAPLTACLLAAAQAKWPTAQSLDGLTLPYRNSTMGDDRVESHPYDGRYWITGSNRQDDRPQIVDFPELNAIVDPNMFFSGCIVHAAVHFWAYQSGDSYGLSCDMDHIALVSNSQDLERYDNRKSARAVFGSIAGAPPATAGVGGHAGPAGVAYNPNQAGPAGPAGVAYNPNQAGPAGPAGVAYNPNQAMTTAMAALGGPSQQPVQQQPAFDPNTGQPVQQQPAFDPNTGQPVQQQPVQQQPVQQQPAFDPNTGQPVQQNQPGGVRPGHPSDGFMS